MRLHDLVPAPGSNKRRKIVGRGVGSGHGKTSTRGHKGQRARSGGKKGLGLFEGGQQPIYRRLPKRGFTNIHKERFAPVNIAKIAGFADVTEFTHEVFVKLGLAGKNEKIKVLGTGEISRAVNVTAHTFSESATRKITAAGGKVTATAVEPGK
ncbi:MAG: 50S ribosomal protein L15 [Nitrospinae bacterium]|nr:50S ribosomal protein L15 [Nitrospinota bacterium]